jgi:hypothetical protein
VNAIMAAHVVAVQLSYGAVEFNHVGELLDAVRHADADMYVRKRERAAQKRRLGFEIVEDPHKDREPGGRG